MLSNIEFGRQFASLRVANVFPINPNKPSRFHGTNMKKDFFPRPFGINSEGSFIRANWIVIMRDFTRGFRVHYIYVFHLIRDWVFVMCKLVLVIGIYRCPETLNFPICRNFNVIPIFCIIRRNEKLVRLVDGLLYPFKFPNAIQRKIVS